jgi:hypothetical protein
MTPRARSRPLPKFRPVARTRALPKAVPRKTLTVAPTPVELPPAPAVRPNPYVDLSRDFTAEGGIAFRYKDIDERWWRTALRILLWLGATALSYWFARYHSPVDSFILNGLGVVVGGIANWVILFKPVEVYRSVEIRPDCMILEGREIFWREMMELGLPSFQRTPEGHQMLCGVYGTRFVEYFTVRRFDELDRTPEVFAGHLQAAMQQQWSALGRNNSS